VMVDRLVSRTSSTHTIEKGGGGHHTLFSHKRSAQEKCRVPFVNGTRVRQGAAPRWPLFKCHQPLPPHHELSLTTGLKAAREEAGVMFRDDKLNIMRPWT
jgi:hypothetical protein